MPLKKHQHETGQSRVADAIVEEFDEFCTVRTDLVRIDLVDQYRLRNGGLSETQNNGQHK